MHKYSISAILFLLTSQIIAAEALTVSQLLDKYRANQNNFQSFMAKSTETTIFSDTKFSGDKVKREICEIRIDGEKVSHRLHFWLNQDTTNTTFPIENMQYKSLLWDGESYFQYRQTAAVENNRAYIMREDSEARRIIPVAYGGAPLLGHLAGDYEPVDSILQESSTISVRDALEQIGKVPCYVIDAVTRHGKYTLWLDPEHGYNIAKATVQKENDDIAYGMPLNERPEKSGAVMGGEEFGKGKKFAFSMENVRFEKINDIWIPMEADFQDTQAFANGRVQTFNRHHTRTEITLNPDFSKLNAFVPDDIQEGTKVHIIGVSGIAYRWLDGKPVADVDDYVVALLEKKTEEIMRNVTDSQDNATNVVIKTPPETPDNKSGSAVTQTKAEKSNDKLTTTIIKKQTDATKSRSFFMLVLFVVALSTIAIVMLLGFHRRNRSKQDEV